MGESWPPEGSIQYSTLSQLDLYCRREGKWSEVPYVQVFFSLQDQTDLCKTYKIDANLPASSRDTEERVLTVLPPEASSGKATC